MSDLYVTSTDPDTGDVSCSCGASAPRTESKRFLKRHPKLCSERRRFAMELAEGTRCVDDEEGKHGHKAGLIGE